MSIDYNLSDEFLVYNVYLLIYILYNNEPLLDIQYPPTLNITEVQYSIDNVTVTVEWIQELVGITYATEVSPFIPLIFTGNTSLQSTISYNTEYNFSVIAVASCRENITASIKLKYGKTQYIPHTVNILHTH